MSNLEKEESKNSSQSKSSKFIENQTSSLIDILIKKSSDKLDLNTASRLIRSGNIEVLVKNLSKFEGLSNDIAKKLIKGGFTNYLVRNLSSFKGLDKNIARNLIKDWYGYVKNSLNSFSQLDNGIAKILIDNKDYNELARYIHSFERLDGDILITLLVKCDKYRRNLLHNRSVFYERGEPNDDLLRDLKFKGKNIEYKKLKEFYDAIKFEEIKENFESNYKFDEGFDMHDAKEAIKYKKGKYIIEFLDQFKGKPEDFRDLINLLIEGRYIDELKNNLFKLWGHNLDRCELASQFSLTNNYNVLIKNADNFEEEGVSNLEIAYDIIKNSELEYRDSVEKLDNYSDEEDWDWINYNIDFYKIIKQGNKEEFINLVEFFKSDFSPLPSNRKLPLKLKKLFKEKFGLNMFAKYKNLFE